jgi:hypothetical protein
MSIERLLKLFLSFAFFFEFVLVPSNELFQGVRGGNFTVIVYLSYIIKYCVFALLTCYVIEAFINEKHYPIVFWIYISMMCFLFVNSFFVIIYNAGIYNDEVGNVVFKYMSVLFNSFYYVLIGCFLYSVRKTNIIMVGYVTFCLVLVFFIDSKSFSLVKFDGNNDSFNYLSFSDKFVYLSLFAIYKFRNYKKAIVITVSFIFIYVMGSRSSLVFYVLSILMASLFYVRFKFIYILSAIVLLLLITTNEGFFLDNIKFLSSKVPNGNRMIESVVNRNDDASNIGRGSYLKYGIVDIKTYTLTGKFLGQVEHTGKAGTYIHNFLSFWRQYGLVSFFLFLYLSVMGVYAVSRIENKKDNMLYVSCLVFSLASFLLTRTAFTKEIMLFFGMPIFMFIGRDDIGINNDE